MPRRTLALRQASQVGRIPKHVIQTDIRNQREFLISDFCIDHCSFPLIDRSNDITLELYRSDNFDSHDGLQNNWVAFGECVSESTDGRCAESQFRGIHTMSSSVFKNESATDDRVTGELSSVQRFLETLHHTSASNSPRSLM